MSDGRDQPFDDPEVREWLDSLDHVLETQGRRSRQPSPSSAADARPRAWRAHAVLGEHAAGQHDRGGRTAGLSRRPGDRAPHQEPRALERDGDGRARQSRRRGHRRPHLDLRVGGDAARGRLQSFLQSTARRLRRRPGLLPGARVAGNLRACLSRRTADASTICTAFAASSHPTAGYRRIRTRG